MRRRSSSRVPIRRGLCGSAKSFLENPRLYFQEMILEPTRLRCQHIVASQAFERIVLAVILINCVFLALDNPLSDHDSPTAKVVRVGDFVFTGAFFVEMVIKMLALGLFEHPYSYFKDWWNVIDFIIVIEGITSVSLELAHESDEGTDGAGMDISTFRTFRVLRPLRTISHLPGLRIIVNSLLRSIPLLLNTLVVCLFYFLVFGVIGNQLWMGALLKRCYWLDTGLMDTMRVDEVCGNHECGEGAFCAYYGRNPQFGITSFDNLLWSFNTIFTCITLEGWTEVMYVVMDASSKAAALYFVVVVLFGGLLLINLTLAVLMTQFKESVQIRREAEERSAELVLAARQRQASSKREALRAGLQPGDGVKALLGQQTDAALGNWELLVASIEGEMEVERGIATTTSPLPVVSRKRAFSHASSVASATASAAGTHPSTPPPSSRGGAVGQRGRASSRDHSTGHGRPGDGQAGSYSRHAVEDLRTPGGSGGRAKDIANAAAAAAGSRGKAAEALAASAAAEEEETEYRPYRAPGCRTCPCTSVRTPLPLTQGAIEAAAAAQAAIAAAAGTRSGTGAGTGPGTGTGTEAGIRGVAGSSGGKGRGRGKGRGGGRGSGRGLRLELKHLQDQQQLHESARWQSQSPSSATSNRRLASVLHSPANNSCSPDSWSRSKGRRDSPDLLVTSRRRREVQQQQQQQQQQLPPAQASDGASWQEREMARVASFLSQQQQEMGVSRDQLARLGRQNSGPVLGGAAGRRGSLKGKRGRRSKSLDVRGSSSRSGSNRHLSVVDRRSKSMDVRMFGGAGGATAEKRKSGVTRRQRGVGSRMLTAIRSQSLSVRNSIRNINTSNNSSTGRRSSSSMPRSSERGVGGGSGGDGDGDVRAQVARGLCSFTVGGRRSLDGSTDKRGGESGSGGMGGCPEMTVANPLRSFLQGGEGAERGGEAKESVAGDEVPEGGGGGEEKGAGAGPYAGRAVHARLGHIKLQSRSSGRQLLPSPRSVHAEVMRGRGGSLDGAGVGVGTGGGAGEGEGGSGSGGGQGGVERRNHRREQKLLLLQLQQRELALEKAYMEEVNEAQWLEQGHIHDQRDGDGPSGAEIGLGVGLGMGVDIDMDMSADAVRSRRNSLDMALDAAAAAAREGEEGGEMEDGAGAEDDALVASSHERIRRRLAAARLQRAAVQCGTTFNPDSSSTMAWGVGGTLAQKGGGGGG